MPEPFDLDKNLQPLRDWLGKPTITIILVIGKGKGANQTRERIKAILQDPDNQYPDVRFGSAVASSTIAPVMSGPYLSDYRGYALLSISPQPKKLKTRMNDADLVDKPGSVQQAIVEAQAD